MCDFSLVFDAILMIGGGIKKIKKKKNKTKEIKNLIYGNDNKMKNIFVSI